MQKGQGLIFVIVGILVAGLIAGGAYYLSRSNNPKPAPAPVVTSQTPQPTVVPSSTPSTVDETANWKTYTDSNFSFKYPSSSDWTLYKGDGSPSKGYVVRVTCSQCETGDNLNGFSVYKISYTKNSDFLVSTQGVTDQQDFYFNVFKGVEILMPPNQGIGLVQYFTVHKGQGYILMNEAYSSPSNKIKDLPIPNPNILSTFKFIQ